MSRRTVKLSRAEALTAEAAVAPTRPWHGREHETGTYHYALDPASGVPDEVDFPILDDAAQPPLVSAFTAWAPGITVSAGQILAFAEDLVRVIAPHTTQADWTPDIAVSLFSRTLLDDVVREWRQPQGAHDAYPLGHVVTHGGKTWENTGSNANVWQPGVFGWEQIS